MPDNAEQSEEIYDCQSCGACCIVGGDVKVELTDPKLPIRLTRSVRNRVGFASFEADDGTRVMARKKACNSCVALSKSENGFACKIYDNRPEVCRAFKPGSKACNDARAKIALASK